MAVVLFGIVYLCQDTLQLTLHFHLLPCLAPRTKNKCDLSSNLSGDLLMSNYMVSSFLILASDMSRSPTCDQSDQFYLMRNDMHKLPSLSIFPAHILHLAPKASCLLQ